MPNSAFLDHLLAHSSTAFHAEAGDLKRLGSIALYRQANHAGRLMEKESPDLSQFRALHQQVFDAWSGYYSSYGEVYDWLADEPSKENFVAAIACRMFWHIRGLYPRPLHESSSVEALLKRNSSEGHRNEPDLSALGFDISLKVDSGSIFLTYVLEQYAYKTGDVRICAGPGDTVLDGGAYVGDTALYFASLVRPGGAVYSFEFIPPNVELFQSNVGRNTELVKSVTLIEAPLWSTSNVNPGFRMDGAASAPQADAEREFTTTTIDDFVRDRRLGRVDFIKLDVEGAETEAIRGAAETIHRFRPKLAVCLYHSDTDYYQVPMLVRSLNPGYRFYVRHLTAGLGETVLYAIH